MYILIACVTELNFYFTQDSMELQHKQSKAVAVTSFSFLQGDFNNFVVGSEEGAVYTACRHGRYVYLSNDSMVMVDLLVIMHSQITYSGRRLIWLQNMRKNLAQLSRGPIKGTI